MSTDINRIAELAKEDPKRQFHSIAHLITVAKLEEAFRSLRKDASAGIDGVTYGQYEMNVDEKIRQLHQRLKEGKYQVCQFFCVNGRGLFLGLGMGARGKGQRLFPRPAM